MTLNLIELMIIDIITNNIEGLENINSQNENGLTALIKATLYNEPAMVKLLLKAGAKLDLQNNEGKTALDIAKEYDYQEIIELLTTNKLNNVF